MSTQMQRAQFEDAVGSRFTLSEPADLPLELVRVQEGRSSGEIEQFSLLFRGPADPILKQGTRHLSHPQLGEMDLFLVPIGATHEGVDYEAAFTRFREKK